MIATDYRGKDSQNEQEIPPRAVKENSVKSTRCKKQYTTLKSWRDALRGGDYPVFMLNAENNDNTYRNDVDNEESKEAKWRVRRQYGEKGGEMESKERRMYRKVN